MGIIQVWFGKSFTVASGLGGLGLNRPMIPWHIYAFSEEDGIRIRSAEGGQLYRDLEHDVNTFTDGLTYETNKSMETVRREIARKWVRERCAKTVPRVLRVVPHRVDLTQEWTLVERAVVEVKRQEKYATIGGLTLALGCICLFYAMIIGVANCQNRKPNQNHIMEKFDEFNVYGSTTIGIDNSIGIGPIIGTAGTTQPQGYQNQTNSGHTWQQQQQPVV